MCRIIIIDYYRLIIFSVFMSVFMFVILTFMKAIVKINLSCSFNFNFEFMNKNIKCILQFKISLIYFLYITRIKCCESWYLSMLRTRFSRKQFLMFWETGTKLDIRYYILYNIINQIIWLNFYINIEIGTLLLLYTL